MIGVTVDELTLHSNKTEYAKIPWMISGLKDGGEYAAAYVLIKSFGLMPRRIATLAAEGVAWAGFRFARRQRRTGLQNLKMAMPELTEPDRVRILRGCFSNLGRLLVEFSHFPELNRTNISGHVTYEGLENFTESVRRGKGVIFLTAHLGAWELSSFSHSIYGHPMKFVVREIDNPRVERLISRYRSLGGNAPIYRKNASRELLKALKSNETVGILVDQNTTSDEGEFVDFFGVPAATTTAVARLAMRTGAAVIPGFLIWDTATHRHRLHFDPPLTLIETGDHARDVLENTRMFNSVLECFIRKYPDQWLWIHRRWKTRPEGEPSLYD
jgi:KDO2-lipid IV(A) lauroyltransferase